jgi:hypothetical protein
MATHKHMAVNTSDSDTSGLVTLAPAIFHEKRISLIFVRHLVGSFMYCRSPLLASILSRVFRVKCLFVKMIIFARMRFKTTYNFGIDLHPILIATFYILLISFIQLTISPHLC